MVPLICLRLRVTPFQPFEIRWSSGDVFRVDHPENAAIVGRNVAVLLPDGENAIVLCALHIAGVSGLDTVEA